MESGFKPRKLSFFNTDTLFCIVPSSVSLENEGLFTFAPKEAQSSFIHSPNNSINWLPRHCSVFWVWLWTQQTRACSPGASFSPNTWSFLIASGKARFSSFLLLFKNFLAVFTGFFIPINFRITLYVLQNPVRTLIHSISCIDTN